MKVPGSNPGVGSRLALKATGAKSEIALLLS
jgi:hypothetical protein